jgi:hypothetical protein
VRGSGIKKGLTYQYIIPFFGLYVAFTDIRFEGCAKKGCTDWGYMCAVCTGVIVFFCVCVCVCVGVRTSSFFFLYSAHVRANVSSINARSINASTINATHVGCINVGCIYASSPELVLYLVVKS